MTIKTTIIPTVTGNFIQGTLGLSNEEKFVVDEYQTYTIPSKHTLRSVTKPLAGSQDYLTISEVEGVQISMSKENYQKMCHKLYQLHREEEQRMENPKTFELWMGYKTYMELTRTD